MMQRLNYRSVLLGVALLGMGAQARADEPAPAPAAAPAATLSDAQIVAILLDSNQSEVEFGKLGTHQTKNAAIKAFAEKLVSDHGAVHKETSEWAKKNKIKAAESDASKSIKSTGKETLSALKKLKGAEFDKAYIEKAVALHQDTLDSIDKTLLPNVKNEELKGLLNKVRPTVSAHLDESKKIQGDLNAPKT